MSACGDFKPLSHVTEAINTITDIPLMENVCVLTLCVDNGAADARGDGEKTEGARGGGEEKTGVRCNLAVPSFTANVMSNLQ